MGCTHSKNSKSKSGLKKNEQPLERSLHNSHVAHFAETQPSTQSTSVESEEPQRNHYTKSFLNESKNSTNQKTGAQEKSSKKHDAQATTFGMDQQVSVPSQNKPQTSENPLEKMESVPHTAVPPTYHQKQYAASTYYPIPTIGEKQKSPEKKKQTKKAEEEKKRKKDATREKSTMIGPNYRPQLTPEDLEYIRRSVQQRNERRAYMMAHRNEKDDTLYELEVRMPEKDYTNRIEAAQNSRVY